MCALQLYTLLGFESIFQHLQNSDTRNEYVNVAVPFTTVCNDEGNTPYCDKEMLERLTKLTGGEEQSDEQADPRWDALKNLK